MASLRWALCDIKGNRLAQFFDRKQGTVTIPLNGARTASVNLSIHDEAVPQIVTLATTLKVYLATKLIFFGPIVSPRFMGREQRVEISAVDPFFRLVKRFLAAQFVQSAIDQGQIMMNLITQVLPTAPELALGIPSHGIQQGTIVATKVRDKTYESGQQIASAITDLAELLDGPDFELIPQDRTDGILANFNVYSRQGSDLSASVVFEYFFGRHNCTDFVYDPAGDQVQNRNTQVGQNGGAPPTYTANHVEAQQQLGIYEGYQGSSEVSEPAILTARAQQLVAAYREPPDYFTVVPAIEGVDESFGVPPQALSDYAVGDTVGAVARVGGLKLNLTGRVTQLQLAETDDAANVRTTVTCVPTVITSGLS